MFNLNLPKASCLQCLKPTLYPSVAALSKASITPDSNFLTDVSNEVYKPRNHPGRMDSKVATIPNTLVKAVLNTLEDYPIKALLEAGDKLSRHLQGRVPPMEQDELSSLVKKIQNNLSKKLKNIELQERNDEERLAQMMNDKLKNALRGKVYNWRPIKYDVHTALIYLLVRAPAEYAVLTKIFSEIVSRDKEFHPRSLFDFGSGVGTVTWAANAFWKKHIYEYYNVDASADMNDLAQVLLQGGKGSGIATVKGTFYRQFLPAKNNQYDLVTSCYTLMELPSLETRLEAVLNLWNKTQQYLVIVEQGTNAGFKVVNEIRDFILQIGKESNKGHVFSPCPHDKVCPRLLANDGTPCNFAARYWTMPIGKNPELLTEKYSYVVLKKGEREGDLKWPRLVRPTLVRPRHTICRMCTADGKLTEAIFTGKKHGKTTYHCARSSKWGDLLPMTLDDVADAGGSIECNNTASGDNICNT